MVKTFTEYDELKSQEMELEQEAENIAALCFLYQLSVSLDCFLNPLGFNPYISLCYRCAAVLQEPLHKGNVIAVVAVDLCCVPFSETVSADVLIAQVVTYRRELLLDGARSKGKNKICAADAEAQTIVYYQGPGGDSPARALIRI